VTYATRVGMRYRRANTVRDRIWRGLAPSSVLSVYYDKICLKFASYHFLLYAVYICQKSLNYVYAFKCYQQKCVRSGLRRCGSGLLCCFSVSYIYGAMVWVYLGN